MSVLGWGDAGAEGVAPVGLSRRGCGFYPTTPLGWITFFLAYVKHGHVRGRIRGIS
jgi:hypothetical protein